MLEAIGDGGPRDMIVPRFPWTELGLQLVSSPLAPVARRPGLFRTPAGRPRGVVQVSDPGEAWIRVIERICRTLARRRTYTLDSGHPRPPPVVVASIPDHRIWFFESFRLVLALVPQVETIGLQT